MSTYAYVHRLTYAILPGDTTSMTTTTPPTSATPDPLPSDGPRYGWFRLRSELRDFYGLSRGAVDNYVRRGLLPAPDAECSTGPLWSDDTLRAARRRPDPTLAAVVPIDNTLGRDELDNAHVYICPARSGHHIGWASPSIIGAVESGNLGQWHAVRAVARYTGSEVYETSAEDEPTQHYLDAVRARRGHDHEVTVYLLSETPLALGHVRVSERARTAGLQRGRLLRRVGNRIGGGGRWLTLPSTPSSAPLPEFVIPLQEEAFPEPDIDTSGFE